MLAQLDHQAYVLHTRVYRETSLIVELFVRDFGRKGVVARGARGPKSKTRGLLQAHRPLRVSWSGRGELGTLTQVESDGMAMRLQGRRLWSALYINELLERLLQRDDPHPRLFDTYVGTLKLLSDDSLDEEPVLRLFEKHLVSELGYGLVLDHEADSGKPLDPEADYIYRLDHGPIGDLDAEGIAVSGACLRAFDLDKLDDLNCLKQIKRLMRVLLRQHLGTRPLKSRELFEPRQPRARAPITTDSSVTIDLNEETDIHE